MSLMRVSGLEQLLRRLYQAAGPRGDLRQAYLIKRTFFARGFVDRQRHTFRFYQPVQFTDRILRDFSQLPVEFHFTPALAGSVEDGPMSNRLAKHLFQAKCLGAQLRVIVLELAAFAFLVFHRTQRAVAVLLNDVALARQSQPPGEHWHA